MNVDHLKEGIRIYKRSKRVRKYGVHVYKGNASQICQQIVEDCWNGIYFQTSTDFGHFSEFYIRDFGWAVKSLLQLKMDKQITKTLEYILKTFSNNRLTTTINPQGKCIDIFKYSPDSISYLIYSLKIAEADTLISEYQDFLEKEIMKCYNLCFNPKTRLIRKDVHFGSIKDSTFRFSSTYDNTMIAFLSKNLTNLGLKNPFNKFDIKKAMLDKLWNKEYGYFYDDLQKFEIVTGDSNTFPYWTDVFDEEEMISSSIENIQKYQLDVPFPLKYSNQKVGKEMFWRKFTVPDYQTHSIKTHMGGIYIHIVKKINSKLAEQYKMKYKKLIEKFGTYLENFRSNGKPISSKFYYSDEGNIWAANYLTI